MVSIYGDSFWYNVETKKEFQVPDNEEHYSHVVSHPELYGVNINSKMNDYEIIKHMTDYHWCRIVYSISKKLPHLNITCNSRDLVKALVFYNKKYPVLNEIFIDFVDKINPITLNENEIRLFNRTRRIEKSKEIGNVMLNKKEIIARMSDYDPNNKKLSVLCKELWSGHVNTEWHPKEGFFKQPKDKIANGLKKASKSYAQAVRRLMFYINRAGKNLSKSEVKRLHSVVPLLKKMYA